MKYLVAEIGNSSAKTQNRTQPHQVKVERRVRVWVQPYMQTYRQR